MRLVKINFSRNLKIKIFLIIQKYLSKKKIDKSNHSQSILLCKAPWKSWKLLSVLLRGQTLAEQPVRKDSPNTNISILCSCCWPLLAWGALEPCCAEPVQPCTGPGMASPALSGYFSRPAVPTHQGRAGPDTQNRLSQSSPQTCPSTSEAHQI